MHDKTEPQQINLNKKLLDRFETPLFDSLSEMQKKFVLAYCQCFDKDVAHDVAGYKNKVSDRRRNQIHKLTHDPKIVAAMDEYVEKQMAQIDSSKTALCTRLLNQSLATMFDVCDWVQTYENGKGQIINKPALLPKSFADINPRFHCAVAFVTRDRDGSYGWDNMAQHRATSLLSRLMLWDQEILDTNAPIVFNFGDIQSEPYTRPDGGIDMGIVSDEEDEIDRLTH